MNALIEKPVDWRAILIKSITLVVYAFVFIGLIFATVYSFIHPQLRYLVAVLALALLAFLIKKPFWGIITLALLLPFHAFLTMVIRNHYLLAGGQIFWIAFWKELLIILLVLAVVVRSIWQKKFPFKIITLDWLVIALFILGGLSALYGTKNLSQAIWGARTDFEFFIVYFLARSIIKNIKELKILIASILGSGLMVALFGLLQVYYFPRDFLFRFGYTWLSWTPDGPLQAYQTVGNLTRIISTFSGAIQLGPYLAILILLAVGLLLFIKSKIVKVFLGLFSILCLFPLYFTYTRSAWLGLAAGLFVLLLIFILSRFKELSSKKKGIIGVGITAIFLLAIILSILFLFKSSVPGSTTYYNELIRHRASTNVHWQSIVGSLQTIKENPLGLGLGKSGLVTLRFNGRMLSENWYLQIAEEMGIVALGLFIAIMVILIQILYRAYIKTKDNFIKALSLGILASFVCFSVVGLFLHAWGDNTVVALTFWILAGGLIEYQVLGKAI